MADQQPAPEAVINFRLEYGLCYLCGAECYRVVHDDNGSRHRRRVIPLTIKHKVDRGRCLLCQPIPSIKINRDSSGFANVKREAKYEDDDTDELNQQRDEAGSERKAKRHKGGNGDGIVGSEVVVHRRAREASSRGEDSLTRNTDMHQVEKEEKEELWNLKMVFKPSKIMQPNPILCTTSGCGLVACCIWSSRLDPETHWHCCLDCQEKGFSGWPENKSEIPLKLLSDELREAMMEKCTRFSEPPMPDFPGCSKPTKKSEEGSATEVDKSSDAGADAAIALGDDEDGSEMWELKKIFNGNELNKSNPVLCNADDCDLLACSKWVCTNIPMHPDSPWVSCLDCQEHDFEGWPPEESGELPVKYLTEENRAAIIEKCSTQDDPAMPNLPTAMSLVAIADEEWGKKNCSAITPPLGHKRAVAENQSEVEVDVAREKGGKKKKKALKGGVTPSTMPSKRASKGAVGGGVKKPPAKPSAATRKRWHCRPTGRRNVRS